MNARARNISVVGPVFRTAQYLHELHERVARVFDQIPGDHELILVDDRSPDDAWDVMRAIVATDPRVKILRLSRNFGQHPAISAAFDIASGDVIVLLDTDLQDQPEHIPALLERMTGEVDVVYTTRVEESREPVSRRVTSWMFHRAFSRISGTDVPKDIGTYRMFSRRVLEALQRYPERNVLYGPLMFFVGFEHDVVAVDRAKRVGSPSSYGVWKRTRLAIDTIVSYTDLPHRFAAGLGAAAIAGAMLYLAALLVGYLAGADAPDGLTLIMTALTIAFGSIMVSLGVLGTYVARTYQEALERPRYIVARTGNVNGHEET